MRLSTIGIALILGIGCSKGQAPKDLVTKDPVTYRVTMTTQFAVPVNGARIDELRVWHALPTARPWQKGTGGTGASDIVFSAGGVKQYEKQHDSHHGFWRIGGQLPAGSAYSFTTKFQVRSVHREFLPEKAKVQWTDYARDSVARAEAKPAGDVHAEVAAVAAKLKSLPPPQAVHEFCKWIFATVRYDAGVSYFPDDVASTLRERRGHCGHQFALLQQFGAAVGIPVRRVVGLNLYAPDGRGDLGAVRADYVNIHTWAEVYFPKVGWVEVEPSTGDKAFAVPARYIQNNKWFQNYAIWINENGQQKIPAWRFENGRYVSDYRISNVITYSQGN